MFPAIVKGIWSEVQNAHDTCFRAQFERFVTGSKQIDSSHDSHFGRANKRAGETLAVPPTQSTKFGSDQFCGTITGLPFTLAGSFLESEPSSGVVTFISTPSQIWRICSVSSVSCS